MKKILILAPIFLLASCQTVEGVKKLFETEEQKKEASIKPLPYRFFISSFVDDRSEETFVESSAYAFDQGLFLETLQKHLPYQIFGAVDADLHITLKEYQTTTFNKQYALSMVFDMSAATRNDVEIAHKTVSCSEVTKESFELHTMLIDAISDPANIRLTSHKGKVWGNLFKKCVNSVMFDFGRALVQTKRRR